MSRRRAAASCCIAVGVQACPAGRPPAWVCVLALLGGRFLFEAATGRSLLPTSLPGGATVVGAAHLSGLAAGIAAAVGRAAANNSFHLHATSGPPRALVLYQGVMRRRRRDGSVKAAGKAATRVLLILALLGTAAYLVYYVRRSGDPPRHLLATGPPPAEGAAGSRPATASAPTTTTAPRWTVPRFKARQAERDAMARVIAGYGLKDERVLNVMRAVPRHQFVPKDLARRAYADTPLPIGHGQTISQPYIVAEMTRLLGLTRESRVLEIGTGSGYQAAVLAHLTPQVYTLEIVEPLAESARDRLKRLGYSVVAARWADGWWGWKEKGPYDAIIVTCAARQIPPPLTKQLKAGGRMVIPVGGPFAVQTLMLVEKRADGGIRTRSLMPVRFVPLLRKSE